MWDNALELFLRRLLRHGSLTLSLASGRVIRAGSGAPHFDLTLTDPTLPRRLCLSPELALGEGYMDGTLRIEGDDLAGFLDMITRNVAHSSDLVLWQRPLGWLRRATRVLDQINPAGRSRRNVAHHYDLSAELYALFLDTDRQYSCAYFRDPEMTLEQAQEAKKAHIAAKLMIEPGMRVLDIGCGWGGMAITLARDHGARVVGVTLSEEQLKLGRQRVREAGLEDRVELRLMDYRRVEGPFDRIVSVGMFEHVGLPQFGTYFAKLRDLLAPDGVALVHTIGRYGVPSYTSPWIRKYIFPGGYIPSLSEIARVTEKQGLVPADIEVWRLHYATTLHHWHERFLARQDEARALYDERFCRMWRFYLLACEMAFRNAPQVVFQLQLARHKAAVPVTRDYLYPAEQPRRIAHAAE